MRLPKPLIGLVALAAMATGASLLREAGDSPRNSSVAQDQMVPANAGADIAPHPLDPLSEAEITEAIQTLTREGKVRVGMRFPFIVLHEPPKEDVLKIAGPSPRREAFVVLFDRHRNETSEAIVDLSGRKLVSWTPRPGSQPPVLVEEFEIAAQVVRKDPRWQKAMKNRGIEDLGKVQLDAWAGGTLSVAGHAGARLLRVLSYYRGDGVSAYGRPIEGVMAVVNMNSEAVVEFTDRPGIPVVREGNDVFDPAVQGTMREDLKPLVARQDLGPSFEVRGQEIRWQNWRFRYALHPRDGLVLYTVGFQDGERLRPLMYRGALSEMLVPYGDPDVQWNWRSAFDQGEYGLGQFANTLRIGEEAPANAVLLSAVQASEDGAPLLKKDVVALYEEDAGILWRHTDYETLKAVTRRARRLVLYYIFTVGNYDYGLKWIFHQDGTLEAEVELTGILLVKGATTTECSVCRKNWETADRVSGTGSDRYGTFVSQNLVAPNHQHFFCFRLDLDVDDVRNRVAELDLYAETSPDDNPAGNAFFVEERRLRTEADSRRDLNPSRRRSWKIFNPNAPTKLGHFPSFTLEPHGSTAAFLSADSALRKRATFVNHPLWVTRYHPDEIHAAGAYPNQSPGGNGLSEWAGGESIDNQDLVLWHVVGVTHVPRVEDWPAMPVVRSGFKLAPHGFFDRNPVMAAPANR